MNHIKLKNVETDHKEELDHFSFKSLSIVRIVQNERQFQFERSNLTQ